MHLMLSSAKQAGTGSVIDEDGEMGCLGQDAQQCVCSVKVQWLYSVGLIAGSQVLVCLFMPIERLCNLSNACHSILFFSLGHIAVWVQPQQGFEDCALPIHTTNLCLCIVLCFCYFALDWVHHQFF